MKIKDLFSRKKKAPYLSIGTYTPSVTWLTKGDEVCEVLQNRIEEGKIPWSKGTYLTLVSNSHLGKKYGNFHNGSRLTVSDSDIEQYPEWYKMTVVQ